MQPRTVGSGRGVDVKRLVSRQRADLDSFNCSCSDDCGSDSCDVKGVDHMGAVRECTDECHDGVGVEWLHVDGVQGDEEGKVSPVAGLAFAEEVGGEEKVDEEDAEDNGKSVDVGGAG